MSVHPTTRTDGRRAYEVRWREHGRNRSRTFSLRKDAHAWDREVSRRRQLGSLALQQLTSRGGPTLGEWISERWAPEHGVTLEQSTRERYANAYAVHIGPWLDEVPLNQVTVAVLRGWQAALIKDGVSPGTIHKCRTFLSSVLRHAAESEAIPGNPLSLVRAPKARPKDAVVPLSPITVERDPEVAVDPLDDASDHAQIRAHRARRATGARKVIDGTEHAVAALDPLVDQPLGGGAMRQRGDERLIVATDRLGLAVQRTGRVGGVPVLRSAMKQSRRVGGHGDMVARQSSLYATGGAGGGSLSGGFPASWSLTFIASRFTARRAGRTT